jgi:hypothetical protein
MVGGVLLLTGACEDVAVRCMRRDALWEQIHCTRASYYPCLTNGIRFNFEIHSYRVSRALVPELVPIMMLNRASASESNVCLVLSKILKHDSGHMISSESVK